MRQTIAALIAAAATVTMMITGTGLASAATGRPATIHAAITGTEFFQSVGSLTASHRPLVAFGAFNASGTDVTTSSTRDIFKFPGGSFRVKHKATHTRSHFSKRTCAGVENQRGTYKISGGTGKFAGIGGGGRFTARIVLVSRHTASGGCSRRPIGGQIVIQAGGPVSLP
jgi:hypothetical protein